MKIMLLLGSGISLPSGLPCVKEITDALFCEEWRSHGDLTYLPGPEPNETFRDSNWVLRLQPFLCLLKSYADKYLFERSKRIANYEDLFYLAQQLADEENGGIDNPAIQMFAARIKRRQCKTLCCNKWGDKVTYGNLLERACDFIQWVVQHKLSTEEHPKGLDLIKGLAECTDVERLDIVTLNHDILVERLYRENDIQFADGFGSPDGDVRDLDPSTYDDCVKVRLVKLHGSIDWLMFCSKRDGRKDYRYCMTSRLNARDYRDAQGNHLTKRRALLFLTGTNNKTMSYTLGIHAEMHYRFHQFLHLHDTIVMSGYGWSDLVINARLRNWLYACDRNKIYLLHENPSEELVASFTELEREFRLIRINKWLQNMNSQELLQVIACTRASMPVAKKRSEAEDVAEMFDL